LKTLCRVKEIRNKKPCYIIPLKTSEYDKSIKIQSRLEVAVREVKRKEVINKGVLFGVMKVL
jgi:hypothetical protein